MMTLVSVLAVPALFIAPFALMVLFGAARNSEWALAMKTLPVAVVTVSLVAVAWMGAPKIRSSAGNCYTEWDGRSNSTVCD
mgnify:FL=1